MIVFTGNEIIQIEFNLNLEKNQTEFDARTRRVSLISRTRARAVCSVPPPLLPLSRGVFEFSGNDNSLAIIVFTSNKLTQIKFDLNLEKTN